MLKLFGNLKRLPAGVWMLILFASLFLRDLTANLTINHGLFVQFIEEMTKVAPEFGEMFQSLTSVEWISWIIEPAILILLFEVVSSVIISFAMGRRALTVQKSFIVYDLRIFYVCATLATAILSPLSLALPTAYAAYWTQLIKIPLYTACYILFYWLSGRHSIVWGQKAAIWTLAATIVSVYFVVVDGFFGLMGVVGASGAATADIVMSSLVFAFALLSAAAMFAFGTFVKKAERNNPPPPPPPVEEEEKVEIFKGFGF